MNWELLKFLFAKPKKQNADETRAKWTEASAIDAKVKEIIAEEFDLDPNSVTSDTNAYEEGDSVSTEEILMLCEEAFGIDIPNEASEHLATVGQITNYVQQQLLNKTDQP